jgi:molecular chaperone GrpE (heat shock protein)
MNDREPPHPADSTGTLEAGPSLNDFPVDDEVGQSKGLADRLDRLSEQFEGLLELLKETISEVSRARTDEQLLNNLHERNRELAERFHEREVLQPILLGLISTADRHRQQVLRAREMLAMPKYSQQTAQAALRHLVDSHEADRLDIENLLANLGVEAFESPEPLFQASCQHCIERVETDRPELHHQTAQRLLPGYRRSERIIRPEKVSVYVNHHPPKNPKEANEKE